MNQHHSTSANSNHGNKVQYSLHNQSTEANSNMNIMNNNNNNINNVDVDVDVDDASYPYCIIENSKENSHINNNNIININNNINTMNNNFMEEGNINSNNNPDSDNNNNGPAMSSVPTVRAEELIDLLNQPQRSQINKLNENNNISNNNSNNSSNGVCCPPGWYFSVYDADISQHYSIPSEQV